MANPNPIPLTADARRRGGQNQKRGLAKATIALRLLEQVAMSNDATKALELIDAILVGRQGNELRVRFIEKLYESIIDASNAEHLHELRSQLRSKEMILQQILKQSTQSQALALYQKLGENEGQNND
ncbi:hypothetical protein [Shewanella algae]|uniref:hypothetical protein n=1 Tax=Shewanella algae TaxID=38313 RepID=UPI000D1BEE67|nr:hypothetical protein [Shewanella algae]PSS73024.1 hypothetical protein AYI88_10330 [Shewanella algae]TVL46718.1 hypothetical protein AYI98_14360 [Shewanella algae]